MGFLLQREGQRKGSRFQTSTSRVSYLVQQTICAGKLTGVPLVVLNPARLHAIVVPKIGMRIVITNQGQAGGGLGRGQGVILVITPVTVRVKMRDGGGNGRNERENARKRRKK